MNEPKPESEAGPTRSVTANPAGRAELGRVLADVLDGAIDRAETRRRLTRLAAGQHESGDPTLAALLEAVMARTTRRWWADLRGALRAGQTDASVQLLQRVQWFLASEPEELPQEEPSGVAVWTTRVILGGLALAVLGLLVTGLSHLLLGDPAGRWFGLALALPIGGLFLLHVFGCVAAIAGMVRRQFPAPREPGAVWPFADAASMESARRGQTSIRTQPPTPASASVGLPTPSRRMQVVQSQTGVTGVAFVGLQAHERRQRWILAGFAASLAVAFVLMLAASFSRIALAALIASMTLLFGTAIALLLAAFLRYGVRGIEWLRPVQPPRDPLAFGADPILTRTRADAFLAAYEAWFDPLQPGEAEALRFADLLEVRASPVRVVEVLALASCLLRESRDFRTAEVAAFIADLRRPGLTLAGAATAFAERFPAQKSASFAIGRVTLDGVPLLD